MLWGSNERTNSCSDAAAGILLYMITSANGTEHAGRYILERALNILQGLEHLPVAAFPRQLAGVCWAAYAFQIFAMLGIHQPPLQLNPPLITAPAESRDVDSIDWSPDLSLVPPRPGRTASITAARASLASIASTISGLHQGSDRESSFDTFSATGTLDRLIRWKEDLKFPLQCLSPASPHLLLLQ